MSALYAWKFRDAHRGKVAVAVAASETSARARLHAWVVAREEEAEERGERCFIDFNWLDRAEVTRLDVDKQGVLCWAEV